MSNAPRLRDLLIKEGLVSQAQVDDAEKYIDHYSGRITESLMHLGYLRPDDLEWFIVKQDGVTAIDLSQIRVVEELCELIPEELAKENKLFPIDKFGSTLTIGMAMPMDDAAVAKVREACGMKVRAVYCNPQHIDGAIKRYYVSPEVAVFGDYAAAVPKARGSSSMISIAQVLRKINDLPSLPDTVQKTKEALDDPSVAMEDIVAVIERDPLVSVKVLKLANSAAYNFSRQIDDVGMAIRLMGLQETYNLVLASTVLALAENVSGFNFNRFWQEALFAAAAVPELADAIKVPRSAKLSTAALLHDIGQFVMAQAAPQTFERFDLEAMGQTLVAQEDEVLGMTHPETGFVVAEHWDLPEEIANLIRYHHAPDMAGEECGEASAVSLAAFMAEAHTRGVDVYAKEAFEELEASMQKHRVSSFTLIEIYKKVSEGFTE